MKILHNITFLFAITVATCLSAVAQVNPGTSCNTAGCSMSGSYSSLTGTPSMGQYSCLFSTPNANWLAIGIANTGSIHLLLTQTNTSGNPIDVDFALYGPYTSVSAGCPVIGPGTPTVDCSYSGSATEYIDIPNAVAGQVYILLITNFNGSAGTISIQQNPSIPSTGGINCAINFSATTTATPATCNQPTGTVTATPVGGFGPYTYSWNIPGNPTTQTVTNVPPGTYTVTVTSSPNPANGQTVNPTTATVTVGNNNASFSASSTPASCPNGANGTATANYVTPNAAGVTATYLWSNGATTQQATGLLPGTYTCTITLSNGCTGTATTTVGANNVTYSATSTIVSCAGGADGTATATMTPVVGTLSYLWNDPNAQTTQTATGLAAGNYTVTVTSSIGCTGTANVTVGEIPGMTATTITQDPSCNSGNDGVITATVTNGTAPYTYSWDNSASTQNFANDLEAGTHTVTITDNLGCVITATETLGEPAPLAITSLTPDLIICSEDNTTLSVNGIGGSSPYTFTWYENNVEIGTGTSITVDPVNSGTQYCVVMSEQCGSPTTDSCMVITFPEPIIPSFVPDRVKSCQPGTFEFTNTSQNVAEIDSVQISFGDGEFFTAQDGNSVTHTYPDAGIYDMNVTVTSIYGCTYTALIPEIVEVIAIPTADFTMSSNPTTIFETVIKMQDNSSPGVVNWQWFAEGATPMSSTSQNPVFVFPEGVLGTYTVELIVETDEGCSDTVDYELIVNSDILFFAPNSFTPDGDEFNQTWTFAIQGVDEYNFELLIFNRWGEIVWETHDIHSQWDGTYLGKIVPAGTYSWVARVKDIYSDEKREFNGYINVLR